MKLSAYERMAIMQILPRIGGIFVLRTAKAVGEKLQFTEDEQKMLDVKFVNDKETWDAKKAKDLVIECELTASEMDLVKDEMRKLDEKKQLTVHLVDLYDRFVGFPTR